ncbi:hypothetical protein LTR75_003541 [Friedmanniomyces endolithicus]|nr:hypothetical protein LTR75_003541 [Friedmanniomyces endolithicus]
MYKTFERDYACDITAVAQLGEAQLALYLLALDPEAFCQHITQTTAVNTDVAANIVPLPTSILCLRRVLRQSIRVHRHDIELGKGILHFQITFVELRQAKVEAAQYRSIHQRTMQTAAVRCGSADDEVTWTNPKRWILQQAVANRLLDLFTYRNVNLSAKTICAQQAKGLDSFEYFYTYTKESLNVMPLTDRIGMAWYLCQPSAKCCYLVSELLYIVCEMICAILQIPYMSIQSSIKSAACLAAELQFNTNDEMKVLVCSSRVAAESLNLQHSGWNMIVIDLVLINTLIQMAGRLFRFGQKRPQTIKVLTVDESYNQYIQANNVVRYCAQIAANADLSTDPSILAAACEAAAQHYAANKGVDVEAYTQYLLEKARDAQLDGLVRSSLSIRSDRAPWKDSTLNLAEKNILPMECLFQLSQGGELAQLMVQQLNVAQAL